MIRQLADKLRDDLDDLGAELEVATKRADRSRITKRVRLVKELLRWCESRAGYVR
jgi:hypothetical protein